ncbi:GAF domain-containing protein [Baaleninema sp.]|uniref:GAF domain-containing protein n=1 Tax=Baaleninema sp. TaxID=3101197 RepID=UPI003D0634B1
MNAEEQTQDLKQRLDREVLLHRMTNRIRQSLELQEVLDAAAVETRAFLEVDRVKIYRFNPDESGEVVAESVVEGRLPSLLGLSFPADDIPPSARERFVKERVRTVINVNQRSIGLSQLELSDLPDEHRRLDSCHAEYLTSMGVTSSLGVPILQGERLWGLLVAHHSEPRNYDRSKLQLVQAVVDRLSIAIAQSELLAETRRQTQRQATINKISALLHAQPTVELEAALNASVEALDGVGGKLYVVGETPLHFNSGICPNFSDSLALENAYGDWVSALIRENNRGNGRHSLDLFETQNLKAVPSLAPVANHFLEMGVRGILVLPLHYRQQFFGYLSVFRPETDTEIWWAGQFDPTERQERPRQSFEAWRQLKRGQSQPWTEDHRHLARELGERFASAVQQFLLYRQVRNLNATLERQVAERTAQLQQSLELTEALAQIADQIRGCLDSEQILQTIVREVRALLDTDRVVIYQLLDEEGGEITVEDVRGSWKSIVGASTPPGCFPERVRQQYRLGGAKAIADVDAIDLTPCHREFLDSMQVRASLIVPVRRDDMLWGLLVAHECQGPRHWKPREVEVVEQLAKQAAIAISQAELFAQNQQATERANAKAQQLERALEELKQTQTQLIQSEKMSSLGQLVAGVAHEINNPVNFIYGNLMHTTEYTEELIDLLQLYQEHYPQPVPEILDRAEEIDLEFLVEDLPHMLGSMKLGAERIRQIVLSLRNFSRLDQSDLKPVNLHDGIEGTLTILHHRLKAKANRPEIQVVKRYGDLPPVECYAGQLNQVFMNLLSNAIEAFDGFDESKGKRCIEIQTEALEGNWVRVTIRDNGCGIPEKVRSRIFDPFFTTKPVGIGTGLGLSIGYQIVVDKHHGRFECESQAGVGTEFRLEIPVVQKSAGQRSHSDTPASAAKI